MSEAHYVSVEKTARYYLSGPLDGTYKSICFALHGYGQLGKYFIHPFKDKTFSDILFIAPEGFHRFYLLGNKGRVGASWMTKEDRLRDIEDYCRYLDQMYSLFQELIKKTGNVGILGFSQGVATACRWLSHSAFSFDYLINYAGAFPPDLDLQQSLVRMQSLPVYMLIGDEDEYISPQKFQEHLTILQQQGFKVKPHHFKGQHRIYPEVLAEVFSKVIDL